MKIQRLALVFTIAFGVTLALVVARHLSTEMVAVIVGVVAGVVASIPTSLIVVWIARAALSTSGKSAPAPEDAAEPANRETRIIVMPAPAGNYPAGNYPAGSYPAGQGWPPYNPGSSPYSPYPPYAPAAVPRPFTVIGGEATEDETSISWR